MSCILKTSDRAVLTERGFPSVISSKGLPQYTGMWSRGQLLEVSIYRNFKIPIAWWKCFPSVTGSYLESQSICQITTITYPRSKIFLHAGDNK